MNLQNRNIGVNFPDGDQAEIRIWAPLAKTVSIIIETTDPVESVHPTPALATPTVSRELIAEDPEAQLLPETHTEIPLAPSEYGYWTLTTPELQPGSRYSFSLDGKPPLPDPSSLYQTKGVHGPSAAFNLGDFRWSDQQWVNPPLTDYIIYELHTGTFSPESSFRGIINKIPHLLSLGITAIEIMPVGQFPGSRNWGYDGVYPFAVQDSYGGPRDLQQLVDACHKAGIAVILDVIYNHLGPEGNYLPSFGPYFTEKYHTPWGQALNFDDAWCNGARDFFIENALMWFRDFHIDALRMDAVHAIRDMSAKHILQEIRERSTELEKIINKKFYLIAELDLNDPKYIRPANNGGYGLDAQWIDEFHHALRVTAGQDPEGYYSDFNGLNDLAKSYRDAFVYDGQFSSHRKKFFGLPASTNTGDQFVVFSQNHDQTGNRMLGERTSTLVSFDMCKLMAGAVLASPYLPMLFMGEEWNEPNPFLFFISHTDEKLAALVNEGRKKEFSYFNWEGEPPDPRREETFTTSSLQWSLKDKGQHKTMFTYYQSLIALRKNNAALRSTDRHHTIVESDENRKLIVLKKTAGKEELMCLMNFSKEKHRTGFAAGSSFLKIFDSGAPDWNGPGSAPENWNRDEDIEIYPETFLIYKRTIN